MLVFLSLYVMLSTTLSILVCAAASLFCACLASVQDFASCIDNILCMIEPCTLYVSNYAPTYIRGRSQLSTFMKAYTAYAF